MKYMLTATALVLILMVMWLPARTPPEIFEETALREALMLRTGEGIPMPETAANLAVEYLDGLVWISGVPDRYTLRPYGGAPMTKDEFAEIGRAAERTAQTEWLRAMKSLWTDSAGRAEMRPGRSHLRYCGMGIWLPSAGWFRGACRVNGRQRQPSKCPSTAAVATQAATVQARPYFLETRMATASAQRCAGLVVKKKGAAMETITHPGAASRSA